MSDRLDGAEAPTPLQVKFGLENTRYFAEEQAAAGSNRAIKAPRGGGETLYRYFSANESRTAREGLIADRHWKVWRQLQKEAGGGAFGMDQEDYAKVLRTRDPYLLGLVNEAAPSLYFDFTGLSNAEYVLDAIEIETIAFDEYSGGGFFNGEAWYDIVLRHQAGMRSYSIDRRLRFTGSGRAVLRFWSDNWYRSAGLAPQGCYLIDITFVFLVNGRTERISTKPFKIDV